MTQSLSVLVDLRGQRYCESIGFDVQNENLLNYVNTQAQRDTTLWQPHSENVNNPASIAPDIRMVMPITGRRPGTQIKYHS